jgi:hypothetical protein
MVRGSVSHSWDAETPEGKARWFQSLSMEERMDVFCEFTELALSINPRIADQKPYPKPASGRIRILTRP